MYLIIVRGFEGRAVNMHMDRRALAPGLIIAIAVVACAGAIRIDFARGYWADEFWTLFMTGHDVGLVRSFADRWMQDIHPPIYYASAWLFSGAFGNTVPIDRMFNILPLAVTMTLFATWRQSDLTAKSFRVALALMLLALFDFQQYLSEARSYFFVICAAAVSVWSAYETFVDSRPVSQAPGLTIIVVAANSLWITLHYVNGLIACAFVAGCALLHAYRRRFGWSGLFLSIACVSFVLWCLSFRAELAVFRLQAKPSPSLHGVVDCIRIFAVLAWHCFKANPVIGVLAIWAAVRRREQPAYLWVLLGTVVVSLIALATFNGFRPTLIPRYVMSVQAVMIAAIALLASDSLGRSRAALLLAALLALLTVAKHAWFSTPEDNWFGTGKIIASLKRDCPASRVYVVRDPLLGKAAVNRPPPDADEVRALAYRTIASKFGFAINGGTPVLAGDCPTLIWAEHVGTPVVSPAIIARNELLDRSRIASSKEFKGYSGVVFAYWPRAD